MAEKRYPLTILFIEKHLQQSIKTHLFKQLDLKILLSYHEGSACQVNKRRIKKRIESRIREKRGFI